jgi:hypothetical protein
VEFCFGVAPSCAEEVNFCADYLGIFRTLGDGGFPLDFAKPMLEFQSIHSDVWGKHF